MIRNPFARLEIFVMGLFLAGLFVSCGQFNTKQKKSMGINTELKQWLDNIDAGRIMAWKGWSPDWQLEDVAGALETMPASQYYELGAGIHTKYDFKLSRQNQPLQVFADSTGRVVLVRLEDAILEQTAKELEEKWGSPASKRPLPNGHKFSPAFQWPFPDHGITLYVLNESKTGPLSLSAISLYVPTDLPTYLNDLGGDEEVRMFEDR